MTVCLNDTKSMIEASSIIDGQKILIISKNNDLEKLIELKDLNNTVFCCHPSNFSKLTKSEEKFMNFFDVVFCENDFYTTNSRNIKYLMQIIVWSMFKNSRLIFNIPILDNFLNKTTIINNKKYHVSENKNNFVLKTKKTFFWKKIEYWNKEAVIFPLQIFNFWNHNNIYSQWDIGTLHKIKTNNQLIFSIDMKKYLTVQERENIQKMVGII